MVQGNQRCSKIIAGVEQADAGEITHTRGYTISYLAQQPQFDESLTVLEQVFLRGYTVNPFAA
ncbi:hypothetical protein GCM10020331_065840 [Ectobacillus funiculus]